MSEIWFTADTHFGHNNIIKYCQRPFLSEAEQALAEQAPRGSWKVSKQTVEKHDTELIEAINSRVVKGDQLWILGDFCWGDHDQAKRYIDRINCNDIKLVWGNHDHKSIAPLFTRTIDQGQIRVKGQRIWLNHYPMRSWDGRFHGTWHLYGHVHNQFTEDDQNTPEMLTRDVGVDACNYTPISFDQLKDYMKPRVEKFEQAKQAFIDGKGKSID